MQDIVDLYTLSPLQEGMLFHALYDERDEQDMSYFNQMSFRLRGSVDIAGFEQAWQGIVDRHSVFRTQFLWEEMEKPLQAVHKQISFRVDYRDWSHFPSNTRLEKIDAFLKEDRQRGFDWEEVPLMRVTLIRLAAEDFFVVWSHHHILLDGWSLSLVLNEWFQLYDSLVDGRGNPLPPVRPYGHYIRWLREQDLEKAKIYWKEELKGFTAPTPLGIDHQKPATETGYDELRWHLPETVSTRLTELSRRNQLTLNTVVQGAWAYLLSCYSGEKDVVFGATSSGRPAELTGVEQMVGLFINTLPVRVQVEAGKRVWNWLKELQAKEIRRRQYEHTPLVDIQGWSEIPQSMPLFDSLFVFENYPEGRDFQKNTLMMEDVKGAEQSHYPLTLSAAPGREIPLKVMFDRKQLDEATIQRLTGHLTQILTRIAQEPEIRLQDLSWITEGEREQVVTTWNRTTRSYPKQASLAALFEEQVQRRPKAVALVSQGETVTYEELNRQANQIAHTLIRRGIGPESRVGLCLERSTDMVAGLLGILKAGGAYVPLDPEYPRERLVLMMEDAQPEVVLTRKKWLSTLPLSREEMLCLDAAIIRQAPVTNPETGVKGDNLAYLIYTSGSTGVPKGVAVPQQGVTRLVKNNPFVTVTAEDVFLQASTINFDAATFEIWGSLLNGASLVLMPPSPSAEDWERVIRTHKVSVLWLTAGLFNLLVEEQVEALQGVKQLLVGGDALSVPHVKKALAALPDTTLINGYGPTENTTFTCCHRITEVDGERGSIPIGVPIANTQVYVLDDQGHPVPVGVAGEMYVGGDGLARGYWNRPELTESAFVANPFVPGEKLYRTGDQVRWLPDGTLEFVGRVDQQVKIRGFRIEPGEIEAVLAEHTSVKTAAVTVMEEGEGEKKLAAYASVETGTKASELREYLKERLPGYMMPAYVTVLPKMPLTPNGKVDRRALPQPDPADAAQGYMAPRTPVEETLVSIWSKVLGVEHVGIRDSFFESGGHSLSATRLMSQVQKAFGVHLSLRSFFEAPTVADLAAKIEAEYRGDTGPALKKVKRDSRLPLSHAQQRLWFLDQLMPDSSLYNIPFALQVEGRLQADALERAWNRLVRRHETLRTVFQKVDGEATQQILPANDRSLPVTDLSTLTLEERQREWEKALEEEATRRFDLTKGPLVQIRLIRMGAEEHILLCNMHHIISDGWSMDILLREWFALYREETGGALAELEELPVQYADYSLWQRQWLQEEALEAQLNWWKEELGGELPVLRLPTDRPRPAVQSHRGALLTFRLPKDLTEQLRNLSRQEGATLFMTLMAAYQGFLHRYTGQQDILVGSPVANRNHADIEGLIGFFVNTLVFRGNFSDSLYFRELLERVRHKALQAYARQDVPFEKLVDELHLERDLSHSPVFQTMFILQNAKMGMPEVDGLRLQPLTVEQFAAKFDLTLIMEEVPEGLTATFEYSTDLFDAATIEQMANHFQSWLASIAADPDVRIGEKSLLSEEEAKGILEEWNDTDRPNRLKGSVPSLVEKRAAEAPDAIALVDGQRRITYRELNEGANRLARQLLKRGVKREDRVAVCADRSPEAIMGLLATWKAGAAFVPMDPSYPQERLVYMMTDADVRVLLADTSSGELLASHVPDWIRLDTESVTQGEGDNLNRITDSDQLAYVLYTSGSTGQPKGVMVEHQSLMNLVEWHCEAYSLTEADHSTHLAGSAFDASVWEIWPVLASGACLHLVDEETRLSPERLRDWLVDNKITVSFLPTPLAEQIMTLDWPEHTSLRVMLTGGDRLRHRPPAGLPFVLVNHYGPTENTVVSTVARTHPGTGVPPIGKPIANTRVYVLDAYGHPVPVGVPGELYLGGIGLARGYWNRLELTESTFVADPFGEPGGKLYRTGDLVRWLPDGNLEFIRRVDQQMNIRGFRIEPGEIEGTLLEHPDVQEALVLLREDRPGEKRLVGYVTGSATAQELREHAKNRLPAYMVPAPIVVLEAFPLTPNGKVDRQALPIPDEKMWEEGHVEPRTEKERVLADIWETVLGSSPMGVHDNFFERGGDSILSIQIVARANQAGLRLTPRQLFEHQTIAELAQAAGEGEQIKAEQGMVTGDVPLTPIQTWFFEQHHPNPHHWNQSMLLTVKEPMDPKRLGQALKVLSDHHDALRLRFTQDGDHWFQENGEAESFVPLTVSDLSGYPEEKRQEKMDSVIAEAQRGLDITEGPLWQAVMIRLGQDCPDRLFLVIHHLAVDGVSWRILLEDLETIYQQLEAGETVNLPAKTTSYREWAHRLKERVGTKAASKARNYWMEEIQKGATPLPVDYPEGENLECHTLKVEMSLDSEQTRFLLKDDTHGGRSKVEEWVLTALIRGMADWSGSPALWVNLEGHGREEILEGVDLSRTVGWFTSLYPVRLDLSGAKEPEECLKQVKEQLRQIPDKGVDFGILGRFDPSFRSIWKGIAQSAISFNYLGSIDRLIQDGSLLMPAPEAVHHNLDPRARRPHDMDVMAWVRNGRLELVWMFSGQRFKRKTIQEMAEKCKATLQEMIDQGQLKKHYGMISADFPLAGLNQDRLDLLLCRHPEAEAIYPLSPLQEGMWFHTWQSGETGDYINQWMCEIRGSLDYEMFQAAWQQVVNRHAILRTAFVQTKTGGSRQVVYGQCSVPMEIFDWSRLSAKERKRKWESLLATDHARGFALEQPPLMRLYVIRWDGDVHRFLWTHHHMLLDGWSLPLVLKDLLTIYESLSREETPWLETVRPYEDYIRWLQEQDLEKARAFWTEELKGFTAPTPLGIDHQKPATETGYDELRWHLPETVSTRLTELSRRNQLTLNTVVQGAWAYLLSCYSGEKDVVFGATSSGRPAELTGVEQMVGLFINTLPVRVRVEAEKRVWNWLKELQAKEIRRRQYEHPPLVDIQGWSEVPRGTPLFNSLYVFENYPGGGAFPENSLQIENVQGLEQSHYPLTLSAAPGREIPLKVMFDRKQLDEATIQRLTGHLTHILTRIAQEPEIRLQDLSWITEGEREQVVTTWNRTTRSYPKQASLAALFEEQVQKRPKAVALVSQGETVTYEELNRQANQIAHTLIRRGIGPESRVGLCLERSTDMVAGLLGILKAGGAYVPLDPEYPRERLVLMMEDAQPEVVLTRKKWLSTLPLSREAMLCLDAAIIRQAPVTNPETGVKGENLAYLIYTSGSTGVPKGVAVPQQGVTRLVKNNPFVTVTAEDVFLQASTINFDAATFEIWGSLLNGASLVLMPPSPSAEDWERVIRTHKVSVLWLTAGLFNLLVEEQVEALQGVKQLLVGGDALSVPHVKKALAALPDTTLINGYGPTENTTFTCCHRITEADGERGSIPIGVPIANTQVYVLDDQGHPVPVGVAGELYVGGDGLARGYWNRPELTESTFVANPFVPGEKLYRTGDQVRWLPDGTLEFVGRVDQQVKIRGFRIEPGEIEAVLAEHPSVKTAAVTVMEEGEGEKKLAAYASVETGTKASELREYLKERLPGYMMPAYVTVLPEMPLTPNGKVDRRALPQPDPADAAQGYMAPRTPVEKALIPIWQDVLGVRRLGVHDDFFELGGHSLLATRLVFRVQEELEVHLPLHQLFSHPTVAGMAQAIESETARDLVAVSEENTDMDLSKEVYLAPEITPDSQVISGKFQRILLTGATGFLGGFLLYDLLNETTADIYCLVRSDSETEAMERIKSNLEKSKRWDSAFKKRIIPVPGDLARPLFGLPKETFDQLAEEVDVIYHNGALVNFMTPYSVSKGPNVDGTVEILRLACQSKLKPIHFVSTLSVFPGGEEGDKSIVSEETMPTQSKGLSIGYAQSKWVAERILDLGRQRGIPVTIYRIGRIAGDSRTGMCQPNDLLWRLIKGYIQLGMAPRMEEATTDWMPVDDVSRSIVHLSMEKDASGSNYHLFNPNTLAFGEIYEAIREIGYSLEEVEPEAWLEALLQEAKTTEENALAPLVHLFKEGAFQGQDISYRRDKAVMGRKAAGMEDAVVTRHTVKQTLHYFIQMKYFQEPVRN
ncbi:amino acid adenylation domain-containing protein [Kroppenstedtia pulmonis]|uniref:Amino acid adenylation domain-containing protein n=1 Tax=Kroppenstedtia pulmonis TaxID=1380685 RepID=A0A7D4BHM7_9BACL|nr:non-ribosomal peptide synthetase [Kroppenstedtia pulmonis]QKG84715.1 amino acid adenylation domain-containing protein [Kroppenstedtia pulmonis]